MSLPAAPPYGAPYHGIVYSNPAFQPSQYHPSPPIHNNFAFISADNVEEDDYYSPDPGVYQSTSSELNIEFGDGEFDSAAAQYCGVNTASTIVSNNFAYSTPPDSISHRTLPRMANLQKLPTSPLPSTVNHWMEICCGGMLAGLSAALSTGIIINRVTLVEKSRAIRYIAAHRLSQLQQQYPAQLNHSAIQDPFRPPQDVSELSTGPPEALLPIDVIFATPPCQAFSIAGSTPGWNSPDSLPFRHCINFIMHVSRMQSTVPTYFVENVPNSAKFHDIIQSLGTPIIIEAQLLGSSALRKTTIWSNAASHTNLLTHYRQSQIVGRKIPEFLNNSGFIDWVPTTSTPDYFPKFMSRFGSWAYSFTADGRPGPENYCQTLTRTL